MKEKANTETPISLRPYYTAIYYALAIPLLAYVILSKEFKGGPCAFGEDLMLALLFGIVTLVMFFRELYKIYNGTTNWLSFALNILAIIIWIALVCF